MARRLICGFEFPYYTSTNLECSRRETQIATVPGRVTGTAFTIDHVLSDINHSYEDAIEDLNGGSAAPACEPSFSRFYIRVRQYPAAGGGVAGTGFWYLIGSSDRAQNPIISSVYGVMLSDGTLKFYSRGSTVAAATNLLGTITTPLELNVWYRVNIYTQFDTVAAGNSDATFIVQIATGDAALPAPGTPSGQSPASGTRSFSWGGSTAVAAFTGGINNQNNDGLWFGVGIGNDQIGTNLGTIDIDDWVVDNAVAPGAGYVTSHRAIAAGTYSEWLTNNHRQIRSLPEGVSTALSSNGASTRISFEVESLASKGITGTIKAFRVAGQVLAARDNWSFGIRQNGVDNYNPAAITASRVPKGWTADASVLQLSPSDDLEIIIRDGSGAGVNATMEFAALELDVEQTAPTFTPTGDIQIIEGTFVGNGGHQDITVAFPTPAVPDFIIIRPDNSGGAGTWWHAGQHTRGDGSLSMTDSLIGAIAWVGENTFTVRTGEGVNDSGETNRFFAVSDPTGRLSTKTMYYARTAVDGRDILLQDDLTFLPEAIFLNSHPTAALADRQFYRGVGHVGDLTGFLDANTAAAANIIQAIGAGTFELGTTTVQAAGVGFGAICFRTSDVFEEEVLCQVGSYTGNGIASRIIPLTLGGTGAGLVIVIPSNIEPRSLRFGSQVGTGSFQWNSATLNTTSGIVAFDLTGFTVTTGATDLNASGVVYNWIAFAGGVDFPPPDNPLIIVEPGSAILCDDCGCRMADVLAEIRTAKVTNIGGGSSGLGRTVPVVVDDRIFNVLRAQRSYVVLAENRSREVECA